MIGGRRVRTIDIHAHCEVPEAHAVVGRGMDSQDLLMSDTSGRLAAMDAQGIDMEVLSINPWWYATERDAAAEIIRIQNDALAAFRDVNPERFTAFATAALQHPELAAEQVEHAVKKLGFRGVGVGVGGSVEGLELADPKFNPFWAKCEEAGALVFLHPQGIRELEASGRLRGNGLLSNTIGNPSETTIALSHLIFEGTLDCYPGLRICAAHGGVTGG
jgi:aminocarboxymuconate-semialdehyde decarboxylase